MPRPFATSLVFAATLAGVPAQCLAVPADAPSLGAPSSVPFGNNNPNDPVFSDTRYQVLVPRLLLGNQPLRIRDLQVAPAGSRLRRFVQLAVTLGHTPSGQLASPLSGNLGAPTQTTRVANWLLPTAANTWSPLGLPLDFAYDPALGDLVVEFRVSGAGALDGSGTAGLRTDQSLPYGWTTGGGEQANFFAGGGIKLRLCTATHGLLALGGGCPGGSGAVPSLGYAGSAQLGGSGFTVQLAGAPTAATTPALLLWSFGVRPDPLDLGAFGAPGCRVHSLGDVTQAAMTSNGSAAIAVPLPSPLPLYLPTWQQWFVLDPAANALGWSASNLGRALLAP